MHALSSMEIKASVSEVLEALRANRIKHRTIVEEAKAGYSQRAAELLQKKLDEVLSSNGRFTEQLKFSIPLPIDQTKAYDVAIKMLELSQDPLVELTAEQVRYFVLDDWDWKGQFIESSKMYSKTAAEYE